MFHVSLQPFRRINLDMKIREAHRQEATRIDGTKKRFSDAKGLPVFHAIDLW